MRVAIVSQVGSVAQAMDRPRRENATQKATASGTSPRWEGAGSDLPYQIGVAAKEDGGPNPLGRAGRACPT